MPELAAAIQQRPRSRARLRLRTPKAYLGWAFLALAPIALTQGNLVYETRVLGLAIIGSVTVDLVLTLGIAFAIDATRASPGSTTASHSRRLVARRRPAVPYWPSGALLCGAIVGLLLDPTSPPAVPFVAGALASASKHLFRYRARHLFNPAAFGLLACSFLFSERASWWGAMPNAPLFATIAMLLAGAIVLDRSRKLPAAISFLTVYYAIFLIVGVIDASKATEAFRSPISNAVLFFALFMVSDPPTAPIAANDQTAYGILLAASAAGLELTIHTQTFLVTALLGANLYAAMVRTLRRRRLSRRRELAVIAATLTSIAVVTWAVTSPVASGATAPARPSRSPTSRAPHNRQRPPAADARSNLRSPKPTVQPIRNR
jgi:Na+-translocating ferredoxin:NAD+ oxidoreductase RnfD subunit